MLVKPKQGSAPIVPKSNAEQDIYPLPLSSDFHNVSYQDSS
jgi:hypothetical protein